MSVALPIVLGLQGAGTILNMVGTNAQTQAQKDSLEYSAKTNEENAQKLSEEWAFNEATALGIAKQKVSSAKAQTMEAGLVGSLSASSALVQTQNNTERDVLSLRMKYVNQIANLKKQASIDRQDAAKISNLSGLSIATDLITGASGMGRTILGLGA